MKLFSLSQIILSICLSGLCNGFTRASKGRFANVHSDLRLPSDTIVPTHYTIEIVHLHTDTVRSTGLVFNRISIDIKALAPTSDIRLNLDYLCEIQSSILHWRNTITSVSHTVEDGQIVRYTLQVPFVTDDTATLVITHTCPISSSFVGQGLYFFEHSNGDRVIVTQFEANDARRMFPCFDAPHFKAPMFLRINSSLLMPGESVYSNGKQKSDLTDDFIEFEETIPLPTYLFAMSIGKFAAAKTVAINGTEISTLYLPAFSPEIANDTDYVLSALNDSLAYMLKYTQHVFDGLKLDIVFAPLKYGGMENYGLITETINSVRYDIVAHETSHQWFGDLVTPISWDHIWLSESFATFFEDKIQKVPNTKSTCRSDAMWAENYNPIRVVHKNTVDPQLLSGFNTVYPKGCALLHMTEALFGESNLQLALRRYIKRYAASNADTEGFLKVLDEIAVEQKIVAFNDTFKPSAYLQSWVDNIGYPIVQVKFRGQVAIITQESAFGNLGKHQNWIIPVFFKVNGKGDMANPLWLNSTSAIIFADISNISQVEWNPDGIGYYQTVVVVEQDIVSSTSAPSTSTSTATSTTTSTSTATSMSTENISTTVASSTYVPSTSTSTATSTVKISTTAPLTSASNGIAFHLSLILSALLLCLC